MLLLIRMSRLLKIFGFVFFFILTAAFSPSPATANPIDTITAIQSGNNFQWFNQVNFSTTNDIVLTAITGAFDEQGNRITAGALQTTSTFMASLYQQKPASTTQYLAYLMNHSGLTKSVYAQGKGWEFLTNTTTGAEANPPNNPIILKLWTSSRNVVYVLFIVIFVAIGFMIMFRSKLNPQTSVNIQLALPNIIVSLIMVTFSFAISGFIIDFAFLGHNLIQAVYFAERDFDKFPLTALTGSDYYTNVVGNIDIITALFLPSDTSTGVPSPWKGLSVFDSFGKFVGWDMWKMIGNIFSQENFFTNLLPLIFAFSLLGTGLKIFFALITKYATLVLSTIFSPFVFLMSAFPGRSEGIGNFIKTMLSAALTFPAVAFMFFISAFFVSNEVVLSLSALPPLNKAGVLDPTNAAALGTFTRVLEPLIGLGILMATTQVPQAIDQALGVKPGITGAATPEIGGALSKIPIIGSLLH